jgi:phosphoesterase RecJ-like protein
MRSRERRAMALSEYVGPHDEGERHAQEAGFERILARMEGAHTICLCAHTAPDGDALGSQLALAEIIEARWPDKLVTSLLADNEDCPKIYRFLPLADTLVRARDYEETPDLFVAVDLSLRSRLNEAALVLDRAKASAIMDHHPCDEPFTDAAGIRTSAAAAACVVLEFALWLGVEMTSTMAQNLLCAIVTDTGRFQYQNTDSEAFECASLLVSRGASPAEISLNVYQSFKLTTLHLKSQVLGRVKTFEHGKIAYGYATAADLERTGADLTECDGLVDVVRSVEGTEVALFLKTIPGGRVRGNLRSKGAYDVSSVARLMGGGGHRAAAGFTFTGDIDEALAAVLPPLRELVRNGEKEKP